VRPPAEPGPAASLAPAALVALAVLSPWAMGAVTPQALVTVTCAALMASVLVLLHGAVRGALALPAVPLWPLACFLALALAQLVPLPPALHRLLAPGSHTVWHPADALLAGVLGASARPVSVDPVTTLAALALTGGLALLALLSAPALARPRAALRAAAVVAACGFALSAYAIWARARFGKLLYGQIAVPTVAPFGPFVSKNHFAGWSVMAALLVTGLALGLADAARRRGRDWTADARAGGVILALVATLAMALASLASQSRGGAMALAAGAACLLALRLLGRASARGALLPTLVPTLVLGAILIGLVPQEAHERMRSLSGASFRLDTWKDTLRLAASSPVVGHGLGAFHDAYPRFKRGHGFERVEHAENDYLETLAETGLLGLGLALGGFVLLISSAGRGGGDAAGSLVRGIGQGATAALAALAVHSAVDFNLRIPSNAALAALAAAALAAAAGARPRPLARPLAAGLALCALALAAATARLSDRPWLAARAELQAAVAATTPAVRRLRLERAEAALSGVLRRRPAHAESWLMLAGTHRALGRPATAAAFARHALALDPERPGLREAVGRIVGPP
jgi:tetratricopeptide (TPR) repeat protein